MRVDYQGIIDTCMAFEQTHLSPEMKLIAGMDEVGRGPLAGPVVVVCAIMDKSKPVLGVRDSKLVPEKKRNELFPQIEAAAIEYASSFVEHSVIDEINILEATRKAFRESYSKLRQRPDFVFMDYITGVELDCKHVAIQKGDSKSYCVGCASILAKVIRDNYMIEMDKLYPEYCFASNKGYASQEHIMALKKYGPCPIHRRSFIGNFV